MIVNPFLVTLAVLIMVVVVILMEVVVVTIPTFNVRCALSLDMLHITISMNHWIIKDLTMVYNYSLLQLGFGHNSTTKTSSWDESCLAFIDTSWSYHKFDISNTSLLTLSIEHRLFVGINIYGGPINSSQ